jgi:spermidine/putrescine transport system permease protein
VSATERPTLVDRIRARPGLRTALAAALPVGFVTALLFVPYVLLLVHSFWRLRGGAITHELTLENYGRLFGTALYPDTILFSAGIAIRVTLVSLLLAYPLAYLLAFKVTRHKQLMYMAVIIPLWVSYLVRAYAWKIILGQTGILNGLLEAAGIIDQPLTFLLYSRWAVILALTHIYTPFTLMPIYAVLEAIPPALKEASQDLYASRWQTFRRIVLMRQGGVAQIGTPRDLYDRPVSRYVADFIGETNLLAGRVVEVTHGMVTLKVGESTLRGLAESALAPDAQAWLTVRPEAIRLRDGAPPDGWNAVPGTLVDTVYAGSAVRAHVELPGGRRVVANLAPGEVPAPGAQVTLTWPVERGRCVGE